MTHYEREGERFTQPLITANGRQIFNPTAEQMAAEGWVLTEDKQTQPTEADKARQRIAELEELLRANDYKVIKCFEAQATGGTMPYDIAALHAEREAARSEINELQQKFNV